MSKVNLTGRLVRDPELKSVTVDGQDREVCQVRVAAENRRGKTVYFDLAEWGNGGRAAAERDSRRDRCRGDERHQAGLTSRTTTAIN
jgi:hypothetical protein